MNAGLLVVLIVGGVIFAIVAVTQWDNGKEARKAEKAQLDFEQWVQAAEDFQLPPILIRMYYGSDPRAGAMRFQREASVLATRGYYVASTSAGQYGGPGVGDFLAFGLLALGKRRDTALTVTYQRQTLGGGGL